MTFFAVRDFIYKSQQCIINQEQKTIIKCSFYKIFKTIKDPVINLSRLIYVGRNYKTKEEELLGRCVAEEVQFYNFVKVDFLQIKFVKTENFSRFFKGIGK